MRALLPSVVASFLTGCCCCGGGGPARTDDAPWRKATETARGARTSPLTAGTANVWVLEVSLPRGADAKQEAADDVERAQHELAELEVAVLEARIRKGVSEGPRPFPSMPGPEVVSTREAAATYWKDALAERKALLAARPPLPPRDDAPPPLELRQRVEFVTVFPPVPAVEESGFHTLAPNDACAACLGQASQRHVIFLRSFGSPGLDVSAVTAEALRAGVDLPGPELVFHPACERDDRKLALPKGAKAHLRLKESCPANVVRIDDRVVVDTGGGVIAVPKYGDMFWHELRDAPCVKNTSTVTENFGTPLPVEDPSVHHSRPMVFQWVKEKREELERLAKMPDAPAK